MKEPDLDELAQAARNRGLKLVRSRVRTPTKRRFGKAGLTDKAGEPIFGMDVKGPVAQPGAVAEYLRNLDANDWGASLDAPVGPRKRQKKRPVEPANDLEPAAAKEKVRAPAPAPAKSELKIRSAKTKDSERIAELIRYLGHPIDTAQVRKNLEALKKGGETPLVATLGKDVVGLCGIGKRVVITRAYPLGRITSLVVAKESQGLGIGRMLVEAAENWMRNEGCKLVEVTSNDRRAEAHAFYRHLGYHRTSIRFAKELTSKK